MTETQLKPYRRIEKQVMKTESNSDLSHSNEVQKFEMTANLLTHIEKSVMGKIV